MKISSREDITQDYLKKIIHYNPETGDMTWLNTESVNEKLRGNSCGGVSTNGYRYIRINGMTCLQHRIAWLYQYGSWPEGHIDHIDINRSNNAIKNLRDVSHAVNLQNQRKAHKHSKCGFLGVETRKGAAGIYYRAKIVIAGHIKRLGSFDTPEQAHAAYVCAKRQLHVACTI